MCKCSISYAVIIIFQGKLEVKEKASEKGIVRNLFRNIATVSCIETHGRFSAFFFYLTLYPLGWPLLQGSLIRFSFAPGGSL